ncbi:transposon Ty3-I Gag-Pol polyprotein, partial [Nephila pilipes]
MVKTRSQATMADSGNAELLALLAEMKKSMEAGQEEMRIGQKEMKKGMGKGQDDMRVHVETQVEGIKEHVNTCIGKIEEDVQSVKREINEVKSEVQEKISFLEKRLCDLEERPINSPPSSEVIYSRPTVKSLTFDGQTSWSIFKTQFDVVSSSNGWTGRVKASQLVASLRGSAAEVLQRIPAGNLMDLTTIERALESRFGDSHLTQFYRTELKTRRQKPSESLQVLAADVERLMSLAYTKCPLDIRESLATQYFIDAMRDEDTQHSTRLMDAKDLKSSLAYSMKYEAARTVSKTSKHHKVYVAEITDPCILGLDFLQEFNFTVDLERNEIRTGGEEIPLFSANIEFPKLCSVFAKEKNVIPARSECLIRGVTKASEHFRYAVTDSSSQISEKGVLVAATLVDLKKETIPARILSMDNKPKTMDKGAIIASYEPVVDIVARPQEFSGEHSSHSILENLEGLNEDQRTALQKLLQEFRNLFSTCDADVGHCNVIQHKINTEDCQKSFNSLKQALTTSPVLTYPRTDEDFILDTDASNEGIGAVLSQKIGNEECVIAYFSKSL